MRRGSEIRPGRGRRDRSGDRDLVLSGERAVVRHGQSNDEVSRGVGHEGRGRRRRGADRRGTPRGSRDEAPIVCDDHPVRIRRVVSIERDEVVDRHLAIRTSIRDRRLIGWWERSVDRHGVPVGTLILIGHRKLHHEISRHIGHERGRRGTRGNERCSTTRGSRNEIPTVRQNRGTHADAIHGAAAIERHQVPDADALIRACERTRGHLAGPDTVVLRRGAPDAEDDHRPDSDPGHAAAIGRSTWKHTASHWGSLTIRARTASGNTTASAYSQALWLTPGDTSCRP